MSSAVGRLLIWVKRGVLAVERIADHVAPKPAPKRHVQLSVASTESFNRGDEERRHRISVELEQEARAPKTSVR